MIEMKCSLPCGVKMWEAIIIFHTTPTPLLAHLPLTCFHLWQLESVCKLLKELANIGGGLEFGKG